MASELGWIGSARAGAVRLAVGDGREVLAECAGAAKTAVGQRRGRGDGVGALGRRGPIGGRHGLALRGVHRAELGQWPFQGATDEVHVVGPGEVGGELRLGRYGQASAALRALTAGT